MFSRNCYADQNSSLKYHARIVSSRSILKFIVSFSYLTPLTRISTDVPQILTTHALQLLFRANKRRYVNHTTLNPNTSSEHQATRATPGRNFAPKYDVTQHLHIAQRYSLRRPRNRLRPVTQKLRVECAHVTHMPRFPVP